MIVHQPAVQASSRASLCVTTLLVILLPLLGACSDGTDTPSASTAPFAELIEQGIARYIGAYTPMLSAADPTDSGVTNHSFGAGDGPLCGAGGEYTMATRNQGAQELMIYIAQGGACWSDFCLYADAAFPGIHQAGILDHERTDNPVRDWNQVFLPYCDGSLSVGDRDVDTDGDGVNDRFHRGLHNLSASLDVAVNTFPAPSRILLVGRSGGGLSTMFALPLVRHVYPNIKIEIINDSGLSVVRPDQPEFLRQLLEDWNIGAFIPASCDNCIAKDGHFTDYLIWQMDRDKMLRRAMLSYSQDFSLADVYLKIGGPAFEEALRAEMQQLEDAHPGRVRSWIPSGNGHTFVTQDLDKTAGGVVLLDWISAMLNGSPDWVSVSDE